MFCSPSCTQKLPRIKAWSKCRIKPILTILVRNVMSTVVKAQPIEIGCVKNNLAQAQYRQLG